MTMTAGMPHRTPAPTMRARALGRRQLGVSIGPGGVSVGASIPAGASGTDVGASATDTDTATATVTDPGGASGTGGGSGTATGTDTATVTTPTTDTSTTTDTSATDTSTTNTSTTNTSTTNTSTTDTSTTDTSTTDTSTTGTSTTGTSTSSTTDTSTSGTSTTGTSTTGTSTTGTSTTGTSTTGTSTTPTTGASNTLTSTTSITISASPSPSATPTPSITPSATDSSIPSYPANFTLIFTSRTTFIDAQGHLETSTSLIPTDMAPAPTNAPSHTSPKRAAALGGAVGAVLLLCGALAAIFVVRRRALGRRFSAVMRSASRRRRARPLLDAEFSDDPRLGALPLSSRAPSAAELGGAGHVSLPPSWASRPADPFGPQTPPAPQTPLAAPSPPRLMRARGSETGSVFTEGVWPPPGERSRLVDPLRAASQVSLHDIVDGVMGPARERSGDSGHTRGHSEVGEDVSLLGGGSARERPNWLERKVRISADEA